MKLLAKHEPERFQSGWKRSGLSRAKLFAALSLLGFANGTAYHVAESTARLGIWGALAGTFGISTLVWIAFYIGPALMLRAPREPLSRRDLTAASVATLAFMLPVHWLSWIALTGLAIYILCGSYTVRAQEPATRLDPKGPDPEGLDRGGPDRGGLDRGGPDRGGLDRGAWVLLAISGAMFWGRLLMLMAGDLVLQADAVLVSWLAWTPRLGNTLRSADGSGYVWVAPGCSSLTNVSLAILCWVLFAQCRGIRWSVSNAGWCLLACLAVVGINVVRISFVVLHGEYYDLVHGPMGSDVAGWLTVLTTVGICYYGVRRGHVAHA